MTLTVEPVVRVPDAVQSDGMRLRHWGEGGGLTNVIGVLNILLDSLVSPMS
jgi:hypothetical protein